MTMPKTGHTNTRSEPGADPTRYGPPAPTGGSVDGIRSENGGTTFVTVGTSVPIVPLPSTASKVETIDARWAGFDPRALALRIEVARSWDEGDGTTDALYFDGEPFDGETTRVFG